MTHGGIAKTAELNLEQTVGRLRAANAASGRESRNYAQAILTQLINPAAKPAANFPRWASRVAILGLVIYQPRSEGRGKQTHYPRVY